MNAQENIEQAKALHSSDENHLRTVKFTPYRKGCGPRFTLNLWDTYRRDEFGKYELAYRLAMHENGTTTTIFEGADFHFAPMDAIDSDACVAGIMGFLTLRKGDTDADYFAAYTELQTEYAEQHAEALGFEVMIRFEEDYE